MITIKNKYEAEKFGDGTSMGLIYCGDITSTQKFRGIYLKIVLTSTKLKEYTDPDTFETSIIECKKHIIFKLDKILFKWRLLRFSKICHWCPA